MPELFSFLKYLCPLNLHHLLFSNFNHWIALCIISYTYTHPLDIFNLSWCEDFSIFMCLWILCSFSCFNFIFHSVKQTSGLSYFHPSWEPNSVLNQRKGISILDLQDSRETPLPFSITLLHIWRLLSMPSLRSYDKIQKGSGPMPGMVWRSWWLRVLKWNYSRSGQVVWRNRKGDWEGQYLKKKIVFKEEKANFI